MQISSFKFATVPPPVEKLDKDEKQVVLHKFTKANLKLNIPLELGELVSLLNHFVEISLSQISVQFKDWKGLQTMIESFITSDVRASGPNFDIQSFVEVKLKHLNAFACFLFFLERKYSQNVSVIIFMLISEKLCSYARKTLLGEADEDKAEMKEDVLKKDSES